MTLTEFRHHFQNVKLFASIVCLIVLIGAGTVFALSFFKTKPVESETITNAIYTDTLSNGWVNWSWNSTVNLANASPTYDGTQSISFAAAPWGGLYLHTDIHIDTTPYDNLMFDVKLDNPTQKFGIMVYDANNQPLTDKIDISKYSAALSNGWNQYVIPLSDLSAQNKPISGFALQEMTGQNQPTVYVDDIGFTSPATQNSVTGQTTSATVYDDSLGAEWNNWSWNATINPSTPNPVYSGNDSLTYQNTAAWGGLYLHSDKGIDTTPYSYINFEAKAGQSRTQYKVWLYDANNFPLSGGLPLAQVGGDPNTTDWHLYSISLSQLNGQNKVIKGIGIQEITGNASASLFIDNLSFTNGISSNNTASPSAQLHSEATQTTTMSAQFQTMAAPTQGNGFSVANGTVYHNGQKIVLHGVSWFGAETGTHVPHGLWARNYKDMITQIKSSGFNAVRVPFCPDTIHGTSVTGVDTGKNADLAGLNSSQIFDKIMNELNNQGLYILLDHHTPDCNAISNLWYTSSYSESQWISDLTSLAARYKNLPFFLGIDLKNEPHGNATWGTGNTATDWNLAAERAGKAVLGANSNILVFVEGIQDNPTCSSTGGNFQGENFQPENCTPISTAAIPMNKLVLSPHIYGPDVYAQSYFSASGFPNNMSSIWTSQFGYLAQKGYTVIPGEWGGRFMDGGGTATDPILQQTLATYFEQNHICNSFYWDWNPNSSDTGGILQDDWTSLWQNKLNFLRSYYNSCQ